MRYSREIKALTNDQRYQTAREILDSIKRGIIPSKRLLSNLYGPELSGIAFSDIEIYITHHFPKGKKLREHLYNAPTDISDARSGIEFMPAYQKLHGRLLTGLLPDMAEVNEIYGEYSGFAMSVFESFKKYGLYRKCGLPSAAHVNRVGAISTVININDPGTRFYSAIAVGHDFIEDLLYKAVDDHGRSYDFERYDEFVEKFIPAELRDGISVLTNHYDIIIRYVIEFLDDLGRGINPGTITYALESLIQNKKEMWIKKYAVKTLDLISTLPADGAKLEDIRWACYKDLYLKDLAGLSKEADNFRFYEIKSFDLSDNGHGIGSLSMEARIKNLLKQEAWAKEGYLFKTAWEPINRRIMELNEDILVFADHFVLKDLLELQSVQDFLISALYKIKRLEKIFYTD